MASRGRLFWLENEGQALKIKWPDFSRDLWPLWTLSTWVYDAIRYFQISFKSFPGSFTNSAPNESKIDKKTVISGVSRVLLTSC